jgi:hypothetical protein
MHHQELGMRRALLAIGLLATSALVACEDGPNDKPFTASPHSAQWNNGRTAGAPAPAGTADGATQGFVSQTGGTNRQDICTGDQKAVRWAALVKAPIIPPTSGAGIDLSGGPTWQGITVEQADAINCQSDSQGDVFGDGNLTNSWGDNQEVLFEYRISTRKLIGMTFQPGYVGATTFKSVDGKHTYSVAIGTQVQLDNNPLTLDWTGAKTDPAKFQVFDDMYRAFVATFASADTDLSTPCTQSGRCIKGEFGDVAYFFIPATGWAVWTYSQSAQQPAPSFPDRIDQSPAKVLPYSFSDALMKLDAEGPIGVNASNLGKATNPCKLMMGLDFKDFLSNCVQVNHDAAKDTTELNKLLGGLSHGTERFSFDVAGVDVNFSDKRLEPTQVVTDQDVPMAGDISSTFSVDQSTLGRILNDVSTDGSTLDLHGSGAVYKEYARLARQTILSQANIADGDTTKCLYPRTLPPGFDEAFFKSHLPSYCTGFEGMLTAAAPDSSNPGDVTNLGPDVTRLVPSYGLGLKLGHQKITFCWDPAGQAGLPPAPGSAPAKGFHRCDAAADVFQASYAKVLSVFGKGDVNNLPTDVQDIRFFFKMYTMALVKHLVVAGQLNPPDLSTVVLDLDNLFFDSIGAGQFEKAEYVERQYASATQAPTDFVFSADVKNGIMDSYEFARELYRGEAAIYQAVLENPGDALGQENSGILTNVFGSPLLQGLYHDTATNTAYYCATNLDPAGCGKQQPPLDNSGNVLLAEDGRPLLARYPGAIGSAVTPLSLGQTHMKVVQTMTNIQSALVSIPTYTNPYDPTSGANTPISTLIPWAPKQPGVGFPIALTGTLDKFVETAQLDFSGTTISANVDYALWTNPVDMKPYVNILAVETTDFLGDVFLCAEPNPNIPGVTDLLRARMYTPVKQIVDWLGAHKGSTDDCGIIIRYSPFDNYVDYITATNAGVRLNITQGGGFGRVVDVTLFVPGQ